MEEGDDEFVLVHSRWAGVLLRGRWADAWRGEGCSRSISDRVVSVVVGGFKWVAVYQPVWGTRIQEMGECRAAMEEEPLTTRGGLVPRCRALC